MRNPVLHWLWALRCEGSMHSQLPLMHSLKPRDQRVDSFQCPITAG